MLTVVWSDTRSFLEDEGESWDYLEIDVNAICGYQVEVEEHTTA